MATATEPRQEKGRAICMIENAVRRASDYEYFVKSQSKEGN